MKNIILPSFRLTLVCLVFFCGFYTLAVWAVAQFTSGQGKGQTIIENGKSYHLNVGQKFTSDKYFWSRPSAVNFNAAGSGGSNKGPSNPEYLSEVQARIDTFLVHNPNIEKSEIPSDLVTSSGSGLDPHISIKAAKVQVKRVAKVRNISENVLLQLIDKYTEKPLFGVFGIERINVLKLNIEVDKLTNESI